MRATEKQLEALLATLKARFEKNMNRHKGIDWSKVQPRLQSSPETSSWVTTPSEIRSLGGALFCDRRYDKVFVYHNGAQSYYAARGFRGSLRV
jgi:hypothetical protein